VNCRCKKTTGYEFHKDTKPPAKRGTRDQASNTDDWSSRCSCSRDTKRSIGSSQMCELSGDEDDGLWSKTHNAQHDCVCSPEPLHLKQGRRSASSFPHVHNSAKFRGLNACQAEQVPKRETLLTRYICAQTNESLRG